MSEVAGSHEHNHPRAKLAGEIALGAAILSGIGVAGLQMYKHRTAKQRHMSHLGFEEQPRELPPLEERLARFGFDETDDVPNAETKVAGFIHYHSTHGSHEKAITNHEIREHLAMPAESLGELLEKLYHDGFIEVEAPAERAAGGEAQHVLYITASGDLVKAETMSEPLAIAVSDWASRAASEGLRSITEQQDTGQ